MMISENEERRGDSRSVLLWAWEMEQAKSARSDEAVLRIDSAEWLVIMLRSSRERAASESLTAPFRLYSLVGVASATTRRLFSVIVPVLSERTCLPLRGRERFDVTWPSSSMIPAFRTWMWSCGDSKQSRSFSMKKDCRRRLWESRHRRARDLHADVERRGDDLVAELEVDEEVLDEVDEGVRDDDVDVGARTQIPDHREQRAGLRLSPVNWKGRCRSLGGGREGTRSFGSAARAFPTPSSAASSASSTRSSSHFPPKPRSQSPILEWTE